jgi:sulfur relay (sulfurtransferase) complex TusBCD TusD component (DsrE family)
MLQVVYVDVAKADLDAAYVASVSKTCFKFVENVSSVFRHMFASVFFYLDAIYVSHMLQEYVPMVSAVLVL